MSHVQCPVCFTTLEIRDVTPCFVCGGWPCIAESFNAEMVFHEWRLPSGKLLVLCPNCELEEFMVPGGWGNRLGLKTRLPITALTPMPNEVPQSMTKGKFCPQCNLRLPLLEIVSALGEASHGPANDV